MLRIQSLDVRFRGRIFQHVVTPRPIQPRPPGFTRTHPIDERNAVPPPVDNVEEWFLQRGIALPLDEHTLRYFAGEEGDWPFEHLPLDVIDRFGYRLFVWTGEMPNPMIHARQVQVRLPIMERTNVVEILSRYALAHKEPKSENVSSNACPRCSSCVFGMAIPDHQYQECFLQDLTTDELRIFQACSFIALCHQCNARSSFHLNKDCHTQRCARCRDWFHHVGQKLCEAKPTLAETKAIWEEIRQAYHQHIANLLQESPSPIMYRLYTDQEDTRQVNLLRRHLMGPYAELLRGTGVWHDRNRQFPRPPDEAYGNFHNDAPVNYPNLVPPESGRNMTLATPIFYDAAREYLNRAADTVTELRRSGIYQPPIVTDAFLSLLAHPPEEAEEQDLQPVNEDLPADPQQDPRDNQRDAQEQNLIEQDNQQEVREQDQMEPAIQPASPEPSLDDSNSSTAATDGYPDSPDQQNGSQPIDMRALGLLPPIMPMPMLHPDDKVSRVVHPREVNQYQSSHLHARAPPLKPMSTADNQPDSPEERSPEEEVAPDSPSPPIEHHYPLRYAQEPIPHTVLSDYESFKEEYTLKLKALRQRTITGCQPTIRLGDKLIRTKFEAKAHKDIWETPSVFNPRDPEFNISIILRAQAAQYMATGAYDNRKHVFRQFSADVIEMYTNHVMKLAEHLGRKHHSLTYLEAEHSGPITNRSLGANITALPTIDLWNRVEVFDTLEEILRKDPTSPDYPFDRFVAPPTKFWIKELPVSKPTDKESQLAYERERAAEWLTNQQDHQFGGVHFDLNKLYSTLRVPIPTFPEAMRIRIASLSQMLAGAAVTNKHTASNTEYQSYMKFLMSSIRFVVAAAEKNRKIKVRFTGCHQDIDESAALGYHCMVLPTQFAFESYPEERWGAFFGTVWQTIMEKYNDQWCVGCYETTNGDEDSPEDETTN